LEVFRHGGSQKKNFALKAQYATLTSRAEGGESRRMLELW
jgi:hypothetical protein